jgi:hypothetical protein
MQVEGERDEALEVLHERVEPTVLDAEEQVRVVREEAERVDAHAVLLRGLLERARDHEARVRVGPHEERVADALERDVDEVLIGREVTTAGHDARVVDRPRRALRAATGGTTRGKETLSLEQRVTAATRGPAASRRRARSGPSTRPATRSRGARGPDGRWGRRGGRRAETTKAG